jgi:hypothetical protein
MNNPYFKVVETEEEMQIFKRIWLEVCDEKHFETEDFHTKETGMHFLIKNRDGEFVGTGEVGQYVNNEKSTVQYYYDFSQHDLVKREIVSTFEIDKVCIYPEYRSQGLMENMFYALLFHQQVTNASYYLGAIESKFFKALKRFYKVPMVEVAPRQKYNDFYLHPIIIFIRDYIGTLKETHNNHLDSTFLISLVEGYLNGKQNETTTSK